MIAKRIYEHAKLHVDDDFTFVHARRWLNEALGLISVVCEHGSRVTESAIINSTGPEYHDLPDNVIEIKAVYEDSISRENRYQDYVYEGGRIYIPDEGTFLVEYERTAKDIGLESDTPEVHPQYHFPISYWVASREKLRFNPQDQDGIRLQGEFYSQIRTVDLALSKNRRVRKIQV